jgi:magnesium-transporting ATPase (P-type)
MEAVIGTLLFAVAVTLFTWSGVQFRQPVRPQWTKTNFGAMLVAFTVVASLMFAITFMIYVWLNRNELSFGVLEGGMIVALIAITVFSLRRLSRQWQELNQEALLSAESLVGTAGGMAFSPANDSMPEKTSPRPRSGSGKGNSRRKAA